MSTNRSSWRRMGALTTALLAAASGCQTRSQTSAPQTPIAVQADGQGAPAISAHERELAAMDPQAPLPTIEAQKQVDAALEAHFARHLGQRAYLQTDKPLYQPGETIWLRAGVRRTRDLTIGTQGGATAQLVSPKGAVVLEKRILVDKGVAATDFELPAEAQGGEYVVQVTVDDGTIEKRSVIVASYEAPRLKKTLEFVRKAYGTGDTVLAAVNVARSTGEPFAGKPLTAIVTVDDQEIARVPVTTDDKGGAVVKFVLPAQIAREDGLLTILADDGGMVESIQKRIPIVLKSVAFEMFPEGGELVQGLPGRVYFGAKNTIGKPADVSGRVVDDQGRVVSAFTSVHDGMGRFELTPQAGRSYHVELDRPAGITQKFALPAIKAEGCTIESLDQARTAMAGGKDRDLRVAAWCTSPRVVIAEAALRERRLGSAAYEIAPGKPTIMALPVPAGEQGAVRFTLLSYERQPLAERLIYRGRGADLKVTITPDKKSYAPRDRVKLTVKTTDLGGQPVTASLGLAVVDDTVLSYADDKSGHILSRLYLEPELGPDAVEEPNFYFGDQPEAAASMDLLMGTRGWRKFEWQVVFNPPPPPPPVAIGGAAFEDDFGDMPVPMEAAGVDVQAKPAAVRPRRAPAAAAPRGEAQPAPAPPRAEPVLMREQQAGEKKKNAIQERPVGARGAGQAVARDREWAGKDEEVDDLRAAIVPVRVFPAPEYKAGYAGPRTDFRETIYWAHDLRTGADGTASVYFSLSDAVTSFKATAEGVSAGGLPGRGEAIVASKLPVSLDVRLPVEVSEGDKLELPVTLTNETDRTVTATVATSFGAAFKRGADPFDRPVTLAPGEKRASFIPLTVVGKAGEGEVEIRMQTEGLTDEIAKTIRVAPLGFPFEAGASGTAKGVMRHEVDLTGAMPGTISGKVQLFPSPVASMTAGMAGMIREPGGCFEQTSSTNYPNVMVMKYLQENDAVDAELIAKTEGTMARGYKLLTGYESKEKGYEWFGENPGHEALTAYGLMEFRDMAEVWDDVDRAMVERTADWLMKRRDGKGGYLRNAKALDSFGRASDATTAAYITWALSEAGRARGLETELAFVKKQGLESKDAYLVSLAALTMINVDPQGADTRRILGRLAELQGADGSFPGARESITMSGGESLTIESTALAAYAFVKAGQGGQGTHEAGLRKAVEWLNGHRGGFGEWGNTQGTVLSLKALAAYATYSRQTQASGVARVRVNGKAVGELAFDKGRREALEFADLAGALVPGKNVIEIELDSQASMPYTLAVAYRSARPQSSGHAAIAVTTTLAKGSVKLGEGVKLRARIQNTTAKGQPMTLARVGLPGGLGFQTWQLKELRDKKLIGFYETRQREVVLYLRDMAPGQVVELDLDLVATVPGTYVAPASSAYLYYTDEHKTWAPPLTITVAR
jgi:hypothetical protein